MTASQARALRTVGLTVIVGAVLVAGVGVLSGTAVAAAPPAPDCGDVSYDGGDGTAGAPYEVSTVEQLQCIRANHDNASGLTDALGSNYTLVSDIEAGETSDWNSGNGFKPIGNNSDKFTGTFNGTNLNITGLYINRSRPNGDGTGLFGRTGSGVLVENAALEDANVTNSKDRVGALVGYNDGGTVNGSYATGNVSSTATSSDVGGLVGYNDGGTVNGSSATVNVSGSKFAGGLVGNNAGSLNDSYATGNVSGDDFVGGLVGDNSGSVDGSYATGNVSGSASAVGGLAGDNSGSVDGSYATGNVSGSGNQVGGLVGRNTDTINRSYATGNVSGSSEVGGLVGANFFESGGTVEETYATGNVSGSSEVGGLVGDNGTDGTVTDSYWDVDTTNQTTSEGNATGLTTSQLKANDSLTGFDFANTWAVVNTNDEISYPYLQNNTQTPEPGLEARLYAGGDGTEDDTYQIATWNHLNNTRENPDANFTLANDINESTDGYDDVTGSNANNGFVPIGDSSTAFNGTFDGNGNNVTGLRIDRGSTDNISLFGVVGSAGSIKNVGLEDANVTGQKGVGGVVGYNFGTVNGSSAAGNVSGTAFNVGGLVGYNDQGKVTQSSATVNVSGDSGDVGGLVGENNQGTVTQSSATGEVSGSNNDVGGLVGDNNDIVNESYATGTVSGSSGDIGGLVGDNSNGGKVAESYATGGINGTNNDVGGLVGDNDDTVTGSYATGAVNGSGSEVGGLVGDNKGGSVNESYATGAVNGSSKVGGLVGNNDDTVNESYATGAVNGTNDVGGLVGYNSGTVAESYATGAVSGSTHVGGLVGFEAPPPQAETVLDSYWNVDTTGQSSGVGADQSVSTTDVTGLTTSEMKGGTTESNMGGFDFSSTWAVVDSSTALSYPYLQANTQQPEPGRESTSDDGGSDTGGSDGTGAGGVQDKQEEEEEQEQEPATTVDTQKTETEDGEEARGTVESAEAGETVAVETDVSSDSGDSTLESVNVEFADDVDDATVVVSKTDDSPGGTPDLDAGEDVGYVDVNVGNVETDDVAESTFDFRVSDERIEDANGPENIQMYRFNDGEYNPLPTEHRGGNQFEALTPGYSVFAIGTTPPNISATRGSLNPTTADAGDSITAVVTLRNDGGDDGSEVVRLIADNSPLTNESVTVPPGGEVTVDLSATLGQPGTYDIATNLIDLGTVDVTDDSVTTTSNESETPTPGPDSDGEETTPGSGTPTPTPTAAPGFFGPGFGAVAALLALCALALLGLSRRD